MVTLALALTYALWAMLRWGDTAARMHRCDPQDKDTAHFKACCVYKGPGVLSCALWNLAETYESLSSKGTVRQPIKVTPLPSGAQLVTLYPSSLMEKVPCPQRHPDTPRLLLTGV